MSDLVLSGLMDRLSKLYGLDISFHDCSGVSLAVPSLSLRAEQFTHDRPYCLLAKRLHLTACKGCKDRSYAHLLEVGNYSGTCPFGIWDVIHQVKFDGFALGAFYVGGLHGDRPLTHVSLLPKHELPQKRTTSLIKQCKDAAKLLEEALLIDYRL